jgi:autotransporter translocation and assembly factor TamB
MSTQQRTLAWLPTFLLFFGRVLLRALVFLTEIIFGLLIFIVLVVLFVLGSQWGRETLLSESITLILDMTPFTADVSGVQSVTAENWQIGQFTLFYEEERLLDISHFQIQLPWETLFEQKIRLDEIRVGEVWLQADPSRWPQGSTDDSEKAPDGPLPQWLNDWQAELGSLRVGHFSTQHPLMPRPLAASFVTDGFRLADIATDTPIITFGNLDLQIDEGTQWVRGRLQNDSLDATVKLEHFPLDLLSLVMDDFNSGWLSADLKIEGSLLDPQVAGIVDTSTRLLQMPLIASTQISYEDSVIRFSNLEGSWDSLRVKAGGLVDVADNSLDIVVAQAHMPLGFVSNFGAELPAELQLNASAADVRVVGPFDGLRYRGFVNGKGHYAALPLNLRANVAGGLEQLQLHQISLQADSLQVEASGNLDFKGPVNAVANFKGLTRQILSQVNIELPPEMTAQLAFNAAGKLGISKSLSSPRFNADLSVDGSYGQELAQLQTRLSGSLEQISIEEFTLNLGPKLQSAITGPGIHASGEIDLQKTQLDLKLQATLLPLRLVSLSGVNLPPDLDGNLSLLAAVKGPWTLPDIKTMARFEGHLKNESLSLSLDGSFSQGALDIRESSLQLNNDKLVRVAGKISSTEHTLGINVADFNLQRLEPLGLKGVEGTVSADIRYQGDAENIGLGGRYPTGLICNCWVQGGNLNHRWYRSKRKSPL